MTARPSPALRALAILFLLVAIGASAMLVIEHFGAGLPGCGPKSACADLANSVWGRVPGLGWPVSFVGLAYFVAALVGYLASAGPLPGLLMWVSRLAGLASLVFLGVMVSEGKLCPYCLAAHLANLGFLVIVHLAARSGRRSRSAASGGSRGVMAEGVAFAAVLAILVIAGTQFDSEREADAESARRESSGQILAGEQGDDVWGPNGFTGRFRYGPKEAPIRLVLFTDYQCPDCRRIEKEIEGLVDTRDDISVSIKHFPFCKESPPGQICNKYAPRNIHPNACWAARASEAAGTLGGNDVWWKMHLWLFDREGKFQQNEIATVVEELGIDRDEFFQLMESEETLERVRADVEQGYSLGLHYTPMIFVNGVELKGWNATNAVTRTVEEVAATNPPARAATADRPVFAEEKYVDDWEEQTAQRIVTDPNLLYFGVERPPLENLDANGVSSSRAPERGVTEIVVWGDYQEKTTAKLDTEIRALVDEHENLRYVFRHYPVNKECNTSLPTGVPASSIHAEACWAATVAEGAARIGGLEAHRKAHVWLIDNYTNFVGADIQEVAKQIGLNGTELMGEMNHEEVLGVIRQDARAASRIGVRAIPTVFVNNKRVPRPTKEGANILEAILLRAMGGSGS